MTVRDTLDMDSLGYDYAVTTASTARDGDRLMVDRFVSAPIDLPDDAEDTYRADLVFYDVDHSGASYEARIFLNSPDADADTPRDDPDYAGSFHIFGHGGCFGDVGHCDVPTDARPVRLSPAAPARAGLEDVVITEAFKRIIAPHDKTMTVTVVAFAPGTRPTTCCSSTRSGC